MPVSVRSAMDNDMKLEKLVEELYWGLEWTSFCDVRGDYGCFYERLKAVLSAGISHVRKGRAYPAFSQGYLDAFEAGMRKITMRALIFEMELCEECKELAGETDEEKYFFFTENYLKDPERLKEIYAEYPLLYQDMIRYLAYSVRNVCEALERFEEDQTELEELFFQGRSCGGVKEIGGGDSDSHNGGRIVLILTLEGGEKIVYKPRSLAVEERYRSFLLWVCERIHISYWWNPIWDRGAYGWCGWADVRSCDSYEELKRYYQRNGVLLCISYLLGSEDLHYENLVACGEYPVIVDLEMGIGSRGVKPNAEGWAEPQRIFRESVLQTGILPMYAWNAEGEGVNVGAVNGMGGELAPLELPVVVNPGTVRMRVEYRRPLMKEGKNLATLNGRFIQPYEFIADMEEGFERTYRFLASEKESVRERLGEFDHVKVRCLLRQTQEYSMVLTLMHHPDFLIGGQEREKLFARSGFGSAEERRTEGRHWEAFPSDGGQKARTEEKEREKEGWIHAREAEALDQGDIPYFWYMPGKRSLYAGTMEHCQEYDGYFPLSVQECMERLLKQMGPADLERQKRLMRTALLLGARSGESIAGKKASHVKASEGGSGEEREKGKETKKDTAEAGVLASDKGKAEEPAETESLASDRGKGKTEEQAETKTLASDRGKAEEPVETETLAGDRNGKKAGRIAAERIGRLLLEEAVWSEDQKDVGWISIIMVGYRERGYLIRPMGLYLYDGLAGIAVFLQRLGQETGGRRWKEAADLLIQKLFTHTEECLTALGTGGHLGEGATGAFTGEASIAFSYMLLYTQTGDEIFLSYLKMQCVVVAELLPQDKNYDVLGGNAGAALVLLEAYKLTGDRQYMDWAGKAGDCLLDAAASYEWGLGWVSAVTGNALTGFAHGAAGIMLALAKLYYYTKDSRYLQGAQGAFLYEEHYFVEEKADWKDLRFPDQEESGHEMAWCHGWGGIVMARRLAERYVDGEFRRMLQETAEIAEKKERRIWKEGSFCLCHGNCGNLALLSMFGQGAGRGGETFQGHTGGVQERDREKPAKRFGGEGGRQGNQTEALWQETITKLSRYEDIRELLEVQECGNYGFMAGIAGIGYSCLCGMEDCGKIIGVEISGDPVSAL